MIVTKHKPLEEILGYLSECKKVFLVGCRLCAATCKTVSDPEVAAFKTTLEENGKIVTGVATLEPVCNTLEVKRLYRERKNEIDEADAILSFACGGGTQTLAEVIENKKVLPGNDSLFQGEIAKMTIQGGRFEQRCSLCGECMLAETGGICPVTRCPKGLVNGPCGGIKNGKCEVDPENDCVWLLIYERLRKNRDLSVLKKIHSPKDFSKSKKPQHRIV